MVSFNGSKDFRNLALNLNIKGNSECCEFSKQVLDLINFSREVVLFEVKPE